MNYLCFNPEEKLTFCSAGRFISKAPTVHPRRTLDTAVLLFGYSGEYPIMQDGTEHILSKGYFRILFPWHEHYGTAPSSSGQSHFWCHFRLPESCRIISDSEKCELEDGSCIIPEYAKPCDGEKYFVLFSQMIDEAEKLSDAPELSGAVCDAYIKIILCGLARSMKSITPEASGKRKSETEKIKEYLRCHACSGLSASDAAKQLGYNSDYLCRIIKKDSGVTLTVYLNRRRLSEAKNLLLNTSFKIADIAHSCGFSDEKYFMKLFSKYENVTPTEYREAHCRVHYNY